MGSSLPARRGPGVARPRPSRDTKVRPPSGGNEHRAWSAPVTHAGTRLRCPDCPGTRSVWNPPLPRGNGHRVIKGTQKCRGRPP
eukprot:5294808-Heterocapsa_arctica.AAC.2